MEECVDRELHRAVGLSDMATLLAVGFRFPTADLTAALADGAYMADWRASLMDAMGADDEAGLSESDRELHMHCDAAFANTGDDEALYRREYSWLFLTPGAAVPVWAYESCFRHRALGLDGTPSMFNTRSALDVQRLMHEAGVATVDEKTEACDSVYHELEFLAHLHAQYAEAVRVGDETAALQWSARLSRFCTDHAMIWLPDFMDQVVECGRIGAYCALGSLGARYFEELRIELERLPKPAACSCCCGQAGE